MAKSHPRSLSDVSIAELRRKISSLRNADLKPISTESMAQRIGAIIDQYMFQIRPLQLNAIYRARRNNPGEVFSSASQLWYPPAASVTRASRLNDVGEVRFYAANMPNAAVFESRPKAGDIFTILIARTLSWKIETLNVAFIGLERALAPEAQHLSDEDLFRRASHFRSHLGLANYKKWLLIDDYLSELLGAPVADGEEHKYKPTIALAKLLFAAPNLDAVNYPSVATQDNGINICLLPQRADQLFAPDEAWQIRVGDSEAHPTTGEQLQRVTFLSRSEEIGSDGTIKWLPPGEGISLEEISRFVRRRIQNLREWPQTVK
jgi:hypothetical protein